MSDAGRVDSHTESLRHLQLYRIDLAERLAAERLAQRLAAQRPLNNESLILSLKPDVIFP
jgi:hypothetical protein